MPGEQLHVTQAVHLGQRGPQIDISAHICERNQQDRSNEAYANSGYENQVTFGHSKPL